MKPVTKITQKLEKPTKFDSNKAESKKNYNQNFILSNLNVTFSLGFFSDPNCIGLCVTPSMAEYCEAYLLRNGLCKHNMKCCVSHEDYPDKLPDDFHIPVKRVHSNHTISSKPTKSNQLTMSNSQRPKQPTKMATSRPNKPQEPSRESIDGNHIGGQRPCDGECVGSLIALFCDKTDGDAYCPNDETCCFVNDNENIKETTQKPQVVSEQFTRHKDECAF